MRVEELFMRVPRCVGLYGHIVETYDDVLRYVSLHNGVEDVYVCLYDSNYVIDKVFFDIDSENLRRSHNAFKKLVTRLEEFGIPYIPVFSGRKGFHIYIPIKPWKPPNVETAKAVLRDVQVRLGGDILEVDRHVFGDVRRKVRFPNTLNVNNYCVPLPHDSVDWSLNEIITYSKQPQVIDYDLLPIDIYKLTDVDVIYSYDDEDVINCRYESSPSFKLISKLIRPCLAKHLLVDRDPPHMVRVNLVSELRYLGLTEDQVLSVLRDLNWVDFDESITKYQIHHVYTRKYKPLSCRKLRNYVRCFRCSWFYWYGVVVKPW